MERWCAVRWQYTYSIKGAVGSTEVEETKVVRMNGV